MPANSTVASVRASHCRDMKNPTRSNVPIGVTTWLMAPRWSRRNAIVTSPSGCRNKSSPTCDEAQRGTTELENEIAVLGGGQRHGADVENLFQLRIRAAQRAVLTGVLGSSCRRAVRHILRDLRPRSEVFRNDALRYRLHHARGGCAIRRHEHAERSHRGIGRGNDDHERTEVQRRAAVGKIVVRPAAARCRAAC